MSAKSDILSRLRSALADNPQAPAVPREYRRVSTLAANETLDMLIDRLVDYKAAVHVAGGVSDVGRVVGELVSGPVIAPSGVDRAWLTPVDEVRDPLEASCVVTSSTVSCAETGTISSPGVTTKGAANSRSSPTTTSAWCFPTPSSSSSPRRGSGCARWERAGR